jgi:hypothetical protein
MASAPISASAVSAAMQPPGTRNPTPPRDPSRDIQTSKSGGDPLDRRPQTAILAPQALGRGARCRTREGTQGEARSPCVCAVLQEKA